MQHHPHHNTYSGSRGERRRAWYPLLCLCMDERMVLDRKVVMIDIPSEWYHILIVATKLQPVSLPVPNSCICRHLYTIYRANGATQYLHSIPYLLNKVTHRLLHVYVHNSHIETVKWCTQLASINSYTRASLTSYVATCTQHCIKYNTLLYPPVLRSHLEFSA